MCCRHCYNHIYNLPLTWLFYVLDCKIVKGVIVVIVEFLLIINLNPAYLIIWVGCLLLIQVALYNFDTIIYIAFYLLCMTNCTESKYLDGHLVRER